MKYLRIYYYLDLKDLELGINEKDLSTLSKQLSHL